MRLPDVTTVIGGALTIVMALSAIPAHAKWPEKTVTVLVHSGAGSPTDDMARAFAKAAEEVTGKNFVVVVKGKDAMQALQNADADGYTISTQTRSFLGTFATGRSAYPPEDFQWVARLIGETYAFGVNWDSKYKTFQDLVKSAQAKPGSILLATFRSGSTHQVSALLLAQAAGLEFNVIPYNSGGEIITAMLGGNAGVAATNPSKLIQLVAAKKGRALVVMSEQRHPDLPDTPTAIELGYKVEQNHWRALIAKKGVPEQTLKEMDGAIAKALKHKVFTQYVDKAGLDNLYLPHDKLQAAAKAEQKEITALVKKLGFVKSKK